MRLAAPSRLSCSRQFDLKAPSCHSFTAARSGPIPHNTRRGELLHLNSYEGGGGGGGASTDVSVSFSERPSALLSVSDLEGNVECRTYNFSHEEQEVIKELKENISKASNAFALVAVTNVALSIFTAEEAGGAAEVFSGLTIGDFAYWGDSFMMVLLTRYALGPFEQALTSKSNQMQYTFNGLNRLGLIFQQLSIGAFAVSTVTALEAAVKYPPIVTDISLGFFALGTLRSLAMWWVLTKHTRSNEEVVRTLGQVRGDVAKGSSAGLMKRSEGGWLVETWDRAAVFMAFGYLLEYEEMTPKTAPLKDDEKYTFDRSEEHVLKSVIDSATTAGLMLSLQAFSAFMLVIAEYGIGDMPGVVSDSLNFFNKGVSAWIIFAAIGGADRALHSETGDNIDHLLMSLGEEGMTELFKHLTTLAIAVSIASSIGFLLPYIEHNAVATGLADGASHRTATGLMEAVDYFTEALRAL